MSANPEQIALDALHRIFVLTSYAMKDKNKRSYFPPELDEIRSEAREAMFAIKHIQDARR